MTEADKKDTADAESQPSPKLPKAANAAKSSARKGGADKQQAAPAGGHAERRDQMGDARDDSKPTVAETEVDPIAPVLISAAKPRRRAGMAFGPEAKQVDFGALSESRRKLLLDDPMLVIRPVEHADD